MALTYKHGTYGEFAKSIASAATQAATIPVYVGTAPVNLIRGYADGKAINTPVLLRTFDGAAQSIGYSADWASFTLGEAVKAHFDNPAGNVGPIVAVNVLDPVKHKKAGEATTAQLTFANGRATIESDTIILDTLVLAEKVEGVDFSVDYDFENGIVIIDSIGEKLTDSIQATYSEVDPSLVTEEDIIGGVTAGGEYSGLRGSGPAPRSMVTGMPLWWRTFRSRTARRKLDGPPLVNRSWETRTRWIQSPRPLNGRRRTAITANAPRSAGPRLWARTGISIACPP